VTFWVFRIAWPFPSFCIDLAAELFFLFNREGSAGRGDEGSKDEEGRPIRSAGMARFVVFLAVVMVL